MNEEKIKFILSKYGAEKQLVKTHEELSELQVEIARILVSREYGTFERALELNKIPLIHELADAYIMISQMAEIVGKKQFESAVKYKLDRQIARIEENENGID